jgi:hypothetical protein
MALLAGAATLAFCLPDSAQAQAGGRGAQTGPALSIPQQLALMREMDLPAALTTAQSAAATALVRASLTVPANPADLAAKANDLAAADLALATARADGFARVQKSLQPLTPEQATAYARGGTGGRGGAASNWQTAYNDHTGYVALFDGKTLTGWEGEEGKWDVQNGAIHRHQMLEPKNFVDFGQYHIHFAGGPGLPGPVFGDFDLKVEFKMTSGNAGVQYRARMETALRAQDGEPKRVETAGGRGGSNGIPLRNVAAAIADPLGKPLPANVKTLDDALKAGLLPTNDAAGNPIPYGNGTGHPWQVSGYQYDIYPTPSGNTGSLYEGQGRGVTANGGEFVQFHEDGTRTIIGRAADLVAAYYKEGDWNQIEIICRGNTMVHMLNGHVVMVATDDDVKQRALKGIISLQLEGPQDNEVWYRNIWIKTL